MLFKYNNNRTYSAKRLKGGHTNEVFSVLGVYLNDKRPFTKVSSQIYLKIFNLYQDLVLQP